MGTDRICLLDVRHAEEFDFANIGGVHIPLDALKNRFSELPTSEAIYCLCHHGVRSSYACSILIEAGFENVVNIEGGIDQWSLQVDSSIPRY